MLPAAQLLHHRHRGSREADHGLQVEGHHTVPVPVAGAFSGLVRVCDHRAAAHAIDQDVEATKGLRGWGDGECPASGTVASPANVTITPEPQATSRSAASFTEFLATATIFAPSDTNLSTVALPIPSDAPATTTT